MRSTPVPKMRSLAEQQLRRNVSMLPDYVADAILQSQPVRTAIPQLIAFDAAELDRITNLQWSPFYSGTDIHSAVADDPVDRDGRCADLLASVVRNCTRSGGNVILPHAMASSSDPWLSRVTNEWLTLDDRVYFVCRHQPDESKWFSVFEDTCGRASTAGSWEIGICTSISIQSEKVWTRTSFVQMVKAANAVFAAALDGEGYLIWKLWPACSDEALQITTAEQFGVVRLRFASAPTFLRKFDTRDEFFCMPASFGVSLDDNAREVMRHARAHALRHIDF